MSPIAARLRRSTADPSIADNFNRVVGSGLGTTSDGKAAWAVIAGAWSVNGTRAVTSTPASNNPIAVVDGGYADVDAQLDISMGGNDALYFRVQDAANWFRLKLRVSSSATYCTYNQYGATCPAETCGVCHFGSYVVCSGCNGCSGGCTCTNVCSSQTPALTCNFGPGGCAPTGGTCSLQCGSVTTTLADLERMLGGTLVTLASYGGVLPGSRLRVVAKGTSITAYGSGAALGGSVTDTNLTVVTRHGIGRGLTNGSNGDASALDNFAMSPAA